MRGGYPPNASDYEKNIVRSEFNAKNAPMATPDLVTFSASGVHPVYAYYFHPQHGEGYNPLWYDPQLGGTPPIHKRDYVAIFRQNVSRSHLRSPDIQGIPRGYILWPHLGSVGEKFLPRCPTGTFLPSLAPWGQFFCPVVPQALLGRFFLQSVGLDSTCRGSAPHKPRV